MQKNLGKASAAIMALAIVGTLVGVADVSASPVITNAVINTRIWNDDPGSTLTFSNTYPSQVVISDTPTGVGYANLHNFRLATNPLSAAVFNNGDSFDIFSDLTISGAGQAEAGLQIAPWWSQNADGRFNVRTTDGEIAVFGGRLPFYSFSSLSGHAQTYTKGETITLGMKYRAFGNTQLSPAWIQYTLVNGSGTYLSPWLKFDQGNPAEDPPYGLWGILNDARVGGHMQVFTGLSGAGNNITAEWSNLTYVPEPASLALLGLGALALVRRRR